MSELEKETANGSAEAGVTAASHTEEQPPTAARSQDAGSGAGSGRLEEVDRSQDSGVGAGSGDQSEDLKDVARIQETSDREPGKVRPPKRLLYGPPVVGQSRARSEVTEELYDRSVGELYRRSERQRSTDPQQPVVVSPGDVTEDLIASIPKRTAASWILYRSALLWHLAARKHLNEAYASAYRRLAATPCSAAKGVSRPSSLKKTIPQKDLILLLTELGAMNRTVHWGTRTGYWLLAGLASGARPKEWIAARWLDDTHEVLRIENAKRQRTDVPAYLLVPPGQTIFDVEAEHPERLMPGAETDESRQFRNVPIEKDGRIWVDHHLRSISAYLQEAMARGEDLGYRYEAYYHECRRALQVASKRAFKGDRNYSLYVMRSQFSANAKARLPIEDVAALMGHSNTRVTMSRYGSRKNAHAHAGMTPRPGEGTREVQHAVPEAPAAADARPDSERD